MRSPMSVKHSLIIFFAAVTFLAILMAASPSLPATADADNELFDRARAAFNEDQFREAERLYKRVIEENNYPKLVADSHYWRAFALYRLGDIRDLRDATRVLDRFDDKFPEAFRDLDADRLYSRIERAQTKLGESHRMPMARAESSERERARERERENKANTKLAALNALMQMDPEKALPILRKIIADDRPGRSELREHALMLLTHIDSDEAESILTDLISNDNDPELVAMAIFWLSQSGGEQSFEAIEKAFRRHDDDEVKEAALFAIGHQGGDRAVAFLKSIVTDQTLDEGVREYAIFALAQSGAQDLTNIYMQIFETETNPEIRQMVLFSLAQFDTEVPNAWFVDIINDEDEDSEVREQALHVATMMGIVDVKFLRRIYHSSSKEEMKEQVFFALAQSDDPAALDLMIEIVREEKNPELREVGVFMMGQFDDPRVTELLLEIINEED